MKQRKRLRLKEYDYSLGGTYYVTICTKDREDLFGKIVGGVMQMNQYANIVQRCLRELPEHYPDIMLDEFIIMPNHVHGIIIIIDDAVGTGLRPVPTRIKRYSLSEIVRAFKSFSARHINMIRKTTDTPIWQRSYYDHVVRNERSLNRIREYIRTNPEQWSWDKENPLFQGNDKFDGWLNNEGKQEVTFRKIL
jgi:putative transposase